MPIDSFERYPLLFGPSPVHRLDRLTQHLGGASIWAKREVQPASGCYMVLGKGIAGVRE